jgi:hypothetical protein
MTSHHLTCFAAALGLCALLLLIIAAPAVDRSWPCWRAAADRTFLFLAQDQTSCFCSDIECDNGTSPGCNATCNAPKQAQFACEAQCNEYGNPSGRNSCECVDE